LDPKQNGVAKALDPKQNGLAKALDPKQNGVAKAFEKAFDPKQNGLAKALDPKQNGVAKAFKKTFDPKQNGVAKAFAIPSIDNKQKIIDDKQKEINDLLNKITDYERKNGSLTSDLSNTRKSLSDLQVELANSNLLYSQLLKTNELHEKALLTSSKIINESKKDTLDALTGTAFKVKKNPVDTEGFSIGNQEGLKSLNGGSGFIADINDYYSTIVNQNNMLDTEAQKYKDIYSTDDQRVGYQNARISSLNTLNGIFKILYTILIIMLIVLFGFYRTNINLYHRVGIVIALILYPIFIHMAERTIYFWIHYLYSMYNGSSFQNK